MNSNMVEQLLQLAQHAGSRILEVYRREFEVEYKGAGDPVTVADRLANEYICRELRERFPGVAVVAEESDPESFANYRSCRQAFFVDPLDGTREFIARNGEFVVMIGLLHENRARVGVVWSPTQQRGWAGCLGEGAVGVDAAGNWTPIRTSATSKLDQARLLISRSPRSARAQAALDALGVAAYTLRGSAGLKGVAVAEGSADIYASPWRAGKRWDACAIDAIVSAAGGRFSDAHGGAIDYRAQELSNANGLLATNGVLHDVIVERLARLRAARARAGDD